MLRITTEQRGDLWLLRLEGKLTGAWVDELRRCWSGCRPAAVHVELADVGFVDPAGKALLAEMHREGVQITAHGCVARAVHDEIVASSAARRPSR
jgi:ABC-type transporter Mla MlaB component